LSSRPSLRSDQDVRFNNSSLSFIPDSASDTGERYYGARLGEFAAGDRLKIRDRGEHQILGGRRVR
jgi:hypothetical protein